MSNNIRIHHIIKILGRNIGVNRNVPLIVIYPYAKYKLQNQNVVSSDKHTRTNVKEQNIQSTLRNVFRFTKLRFHHPKN